MTASLGASISVEVFPDPCWTSGPLTAAEPGPYPGQRPCGSWRILSGGDLRSLSWRQGAWRDQVDGDVVDLQNRRLVLAYGSNLDPAKLRRNFPGEEVVALRCLVPGWAAVWCSSRRTSDGAVVATLTPVPSRLEVHAVLALSADQVATMDRWEGHPTRYARQRFTGPLILENGSLASEVDVYLGTHRRSPLLENGKPLLCADVPYSVADALVPR